MDCWLSNYWNCDSSLFYKAFKSNSVRLLMQSSHLRIFVGFILDVKHCKCGTNTVVQSRGSDEQGYLWQCACSSSANRSNSEVLHIWSRCGCHFATVLSLERLCPVFSFSWAKPMQLLDENCSSVYPGQNRVISSFGSLACVLLCHGWFYCISPIHFFELKLCF